MTDGTSFADAIDTAQSGGGGGSSGGDSSDDDAGGNLIPSDLAEALASAGASTGSGGDSVSPDVGDAMASAGADTGSDTDSGGGSDSADDTVSSDVGDAMAAAGADTSGGGGGGGSGPDLSEGTTFSDALDRAQSDAASEQPRPEQRDQDPAEQLADASDEIDDPSEVRQRARAEQLTGQEDPTLDAAAEAVNREAAAEALDAQTSIAVGPEDVVISDGTATLSEDAQTQLRRRQQIGRAQAAAGETPQRDALAVDVADATRGQILSGGNLGSRVPEDVQAEAEAVRDAASTPPEAKIFSQAAAQVRENPNVDIEDVDIDVTERDLRPGEEAVFRAAARAGLDEGSDFDAAAFANRGSITEAEISEAAPDPEDIQTRPEALPTQAGAGKQTIAEEAFREPETPDSVGEAVADAPDNLDKILEVEQEAANVATDAVFENVARPVGTAVDTAVEEPLPELAVEAAQADDVGDLRDITNDDSDQLGVAGDLTTGIVGGALSSPFMGVDLVTRGARGSLTAGDVTQQEVAEDGIASGSADAAGRGADAATDKVVGGVESFFANPDLAIGTAIGTGLTLKAASSVSPAAGLTAEASIQPGALALTGAARGTIGRTALGARALNTVPGNRLAPEEIVLGTTAKGLSAGGGALRAGARGVRGANLETTPQVKAPVPSSLRAFAADERAMAGGGERQVQIERTRQQTQTETETTAELDAQTAERLARERLQKEAPPQTTLEEMIPDEQARQQAIQQKAAEIALEERLEADTAEVFDSPQTRAREIERMQERLFEGEQDTQTQRQLQKQEQQTQQETQTQIEQQLQTQDLDVRTTTQTQVGQLTERESQLQDQRLDTAEDLDQLQTFAQEQERQLTRLDQDQLQGQQVALQQELEIEADTQLDQQLDQQLDLQQEVQQELQQEIQQQTQTNIGRQQTALKTPGTSQQPKANVAELDFDTPEPVSVDDDREVVQDQFVLDVPTPEDVLEGDLDLDVTEDGLQ